eukprot:m.255969 g.255969  ORF g.255969 m.255969 type:complete len:313 (+) comp33996_c1_seq1:91-1029(+)
MSVTSVASLFVFCASVVHVTSATPTLIISEIGEGSGYNKLVEIYNPTTAAVNISQYLLGQTFNSATDIERFIELSRNTTLAPGAVHVVCHKDAHAQIAAYCDQSESTLLHNGNDAILLLVGNRTVNQVVDKFGDVESSNTYWAVCGQESATKDHVLVRKFDITQGNLDWDASRGTTSDNCEWLVYELDTFDLGGAHDCVLPSHPSNATTHQPSPLDITTSEPSSNKNGEYSGAIGLTVGIVCVAIIGTLAVAFVLIRRRHPSGYFRHRPQAVIEFGNGEDDDLISMASNFSAAQLSINAKHDEEDDEIDSNA